MLAKRIVMELNQADIVVVEGRTGYQIDWDEWPEPPKLLDMIYPALGPALDMYHILVAINHYGEAIRDNSRVERIAIGRRIEAGEEESA